MEREKSRKKAASKKTKVPEYQIEDPTTEYQPTEADFAEIEQLFGVPINQEKNVDFKLPPPSKDKGPRQQQVVQQRIMPPKPMITKAISKKGGKAERLLFDEEEDDFGAYELRASNEPVIKYSTLQNTIELSSIESTLSNYFLGPIFDFTGLESATDFMIYVMSQVLQKQRVNKSEILLENMRFNGCKNLTVWALHYLAQVSGKTLKSIHEYNLKLRELLFGCDLISEEMALSFGSPPRLLEDLKKLWTPRIKAVVIREEGEQSSLVDFLLNSSSLTTIGNEPFKSGVLKTPNGQEIGLFECSLKMSHLFLSDRSQVLITFDPRKKAEAITQSIIERLLPIFAQNIIPTCIMIVALGKLEQDLLESIQSLLNAELSSYSKKLADSVQSFDINNPTEISFEMQKYLGNQLNMIEQIKLFKDDIAYFSTEASSNNSVENNTKSVAVMLPKIQKCHQNLSSITKKDIAEIKSYKMAPSLVRAVGEAVCVCMARKPVYENFVKLVSDTNFIPSLLSYDYDSASEYVYEELKKYVKSAEFKPDNVGKISLMAGHLCEWVNLVYEYKETMSSTQAGKQTNVGNLKQHLIQTAVYSFHWSMYFDSDVVSNPSDREKIRQIGEVIQAIDFKKEKFLQVNEFINLLNQNNKFKEISKANMFGVAEKLLKSEAANGRFIYKPNQSKFVVTDIDWLIKCLTSISNQPTVSENEKKTVKHIEKKLVGKVPLWPKESLREALKTHLSVDKFDQFVSFLIDLNLVVEVSNVIVPIYLLNQDEVPNLEKDWIKNWNGHEYVITWSTFHTLSTNLVNRLFKHLFDEGRTKLAWKNGIINRDGSCDILVEYNTQTSDLSLSVRIVDLKKLFNLSSKDHLKYAEYIFMDYYLHIVTILANNNLPYLIVNPEKQDWHPALSSNQSDKSVAETILKFDRDYFQQLFLSEHQGNWRKSCRFCGLNLVEFSQMKSNFARNYPLFDFEYPAFVSRDGPVRRSLVEYLTSYDSTSYKTSSSMQVNNFNKFSVKFIDQEYKSFKVNLCADIFFYTEQTFTIMIDLQNRTYDKIVNGFDRVKLVETVLVDSKSSQAKNVLCELKGNDEASVQIENNSDNKLDIKFYYNKEKLAHFQFEAIGPSELNLVQVAPELKIESSDKNSSHYKAQFILSPENVLGKTSNPEEAEVENQTELSIYLGYDGTELIKESYMMLASMIQAETMHKIWFAHDANEEGRTKFDYIDECFVYIVYVTDGFKNSIQCQEELAYAVKNGKNIIALVDNPEMKNKDEWMNQADVIYFDKNLLDRKIVDKVINRVVQVRKSLKSSKKHQQFNPRLKTKIASHYFSRNYLKIASKLTAKDGDLDEGTRGLFFLPDKIDHEFFARPSLNYYYDNLAFQWFCLNFKEYKQIDHQSLYCHLMDVKCKPIGKSDLLMSDFIHFVISCYMLANAENANIVPHFGQLFSEFSIDEPSQASKQLNKFLRQFCLDVFDSLALFIDLSKIREQSQLVLQIENQSKLLTYEEKKEDDYFFYSCCNYCQRASLYNMEDLSYDQKLNVKYSTQAVEFIYAGRNQIKIDSDPIEINKEMTDKFPQLKSFHVYNNLVTLSSDSNVYESMKSLKQIVLENNGIIQCPEAFFNLKSVRSLSLVKNPVTGMPNSINKLKNLQILNLEQVNLSGYSSNLKLPGKLKELNLRSCIVDDMPFDMSVCVAEKSLEKLTLSGVEWLSIDENSSVMTLIPLDQLSSHFKCLMTQEQIKNLFHKLDSKNKGFLDEDATIKLNAFVFKKFYRLKTIPESFFSLVNLSSLDLSFQAIKTVPDEIERLVNLKKIVLSNCILLEEISPKLSTIKSMSEVQVDGCFSLKTPPSEICKRGSMAILAYLKRLLSGSAVYKRTKLMLVGLGEAGKTSLVNSLMNQTSKKTVLTDGIDIKNWVVKDQNGSSDLTYSIWDFAGQSVYYNSHQFFLTSRAVYVLVWNVRLGSEYAGLDFWLTSISCHAPYAPIFIVGTHIDEVSKYSLNETKLKEKYKQIVGFFGVSNKTKQGISEFVTSLIETTLQQKYIGESVPEVWINFEKDIRKRSKDISLIDYEEVATMATNQGINDPKEIMQVIQFLNDLGSLQYFDINGLKDKVVINPQWIVDVISCVISVKDTSIIDGKLYHKDVAKIWSKYDESLHQWILKLTEQFDLTYPVAAEKLNIVPCLLPDIEPDIQWDDLVESGDSQQSIKTFTALYTFVYIPAGLFNRIQVRLYQYSDNTLIWKRGSLLNKNNHRALLKQHTDTSTIEVKVQGVKPENVVFLIHEVIETLIHDSYKSIKYEFSFPCPDCIDSRVAEPCLFSSNLLRRAHEFKAPFLQCNQYFHAVSVQDMLAIVPLDGLSNLNTTDLSLEYSLRDLKALKNNFKYDILFWYCHKDVSNYEKTKSNNPIDVIKAVESEGYKLWWSKDPSQEKIDKVLVAIKQAKLVVLGLSDEFAKDEKCMQVFELVKNVTKKEYMIVEFGHLGTHQWLEDTRFASVCTDFRIILQDPNRYATKLAEMFDTIERLLKGTKVDKSMKQNPPDVFISYCWQNSQDAIKKGTKGPKSAQGWLDPRTLVPFLKENGIEAWLDIQEINPSTTLFAEITQGINKASLVVACLSDEYVKSVNCKLEFRFAHISLKVPIVKAIVGTGNEWKKHEISFLAGNYPEVNFQFENPDAHSTLLKLIKDELEKVKANKKNVPVKEVEDENSSVAYQELYELTQRKFLKQISSFSEAMTLKRQCPRLFCLDLVEKTKLVELVKVKKAIMRNKYTSADNTDPNIPSTIPDDIVDASSVGRNKSLSFCVRPLCEHEEGWHASETFFVINSPDSFASYLARIMNILKSGNTIASDLPVYQTESGQLVLEDLEKLMSKASMENADSGHNNQQLLEAAYKNLRTVYSKEMAMDRIFANSNSIHSAIELNMDLKRCELKNGKQLWLCKKHFEETQAKELFDNESGSDLSESRINKKFIEDIDNIQIDLIE